MAKCDESIIYDDKLLDAIGIAQRKSILGNCDFSLKHRDHHREQNIEELNNVLVPYTEFFTPMGNPGSDDWLACHSEKGQPFRKFQRDFKMVPDSDRNTIYLAPLTFFEDPIPKEILEPLRQFASIFFGMKVKVLKN